jgi:energy-coupling factor transporter transmembrane protein EcfT
MQDSIPSFLLEPNRALPPREKSRPVRLGAIDRALEALARVTATGHTQWDSARRNGLLQSLDARVKLLFLASFVVIVSVRHQPMTQVAIALSICVMVALSRLDLRRFYLRVGLLTLFFGLIPALPAALNVIVPGDVVFPLVTLEQSHRFWLYEIPRVVGVTREGTLTVLLLSLRVMNSVGLAMLVLHTTPLSEALRAMKLLRVPDTVILIISLSYNYILVFAGFVEAMYLARKSRLVGTPRSAEARVWAAGRMALLFKKTRSRCEEIYKAMQGRGFMGNVRLPGSVRLQMRDWAAAAMMVLAGLFFLWL